MNIKVLGSCCGNCTKVEALARQVVSELGLSATVEKVVDFKTIARYGVMSIPALVVEDKVVCVGRVPTKAEVTGWLTGTLAVAK